MAILAACVSTGCGKRKLHWSGARASQIKASGFVVPIPASWRDGAESDDEDLHQVLATLPGAHGLVKEDFDGATIIVKTGPSQPEAAASPPCEEIAQTIAKQESAKAEHVEKATIDGDGTCKWIYKKEDIEAHYWMRFHGDQVLAIMCFPQNNAANLATCEQTIAAAHLEK